MLARVRRSYEGERELKADIEILVDECKDFWKENVSVDVVAALHHSFSCIEVATFNRELGVEASRVYLDHKKVISSLDQGEVDHRVAEKKEIFNRKKTSFHVNDIEQRVIREMTAIYIVYRLQIDTPFGAQTSTSTDSSDPIPRRETEFSVSIMPDYIEAAAGQLHHCVVCRPNGLTPVPCSFLKKVTTDDIAHSLSMFQNETAALRQARELAELTASGEEGFSIALAERLRLQHAKSIPRQRWLRSIHRVMFQNLMKKIRRRLNAMTVKKARAEAEEKCEEALRAYRSRKSGDCLMRQDSQWSIASLLARNSKPLKPLSSRTASRSHSRSGEDELTTRRLPGIDLPPLSRPKREKLSNDMSCTRSLTRKTFPPAERSVIDTKAYERIQTPLRPLVTKPIYQAETALSAPSILTSFIEATSRMSLTTQPRPHRGTNQAQTASRSLRKV